MSTLYLDRRGLSLRLEGRALAVYADDERQGTVLLHVLERVVMRSVVEIESSLLARLADAGIGILVFGGRNASKQAIVLGRSGNDAARRVGQYRRYGDASWRRAWSLHLVLAKLKGQMRLLRQAIDARPDLRHPLTDGLEKVERARKRILQEKSLSIARLRGIEGAAASAYFGSYARMLPESLGFNGRNRRPPRDPVNAVLSLGYTLLHQAGEPALARDLTGILMWYLEPARIGWLKRRALAAERKGEAVTAPRHDDVVRLFESRATRAEIRGREITSLLHRWLIHNG